MEGLQLIPGNIIPSFCFGFSVRGHHIELSISILSYHLHPPPSLQPLPNTIKYHTLLFEPLGATWLGFSRQQGIPAHFTSHASSALSIRLHQSCVMSFDHFLPGFSRLILSHRRCLHCITDRQMSIVVDVSTYLCFLYNHSPLFSVFMRSLHIEVCHFIWSMPWHMTHVRDVLGNACIAFDILSFWGLVVTRC